MVDTFVVVEGHVVGKGLLHLHLCCVDLYDCWYHISLVFDTYSYLHLKVLLCLSN